MISSPDVQAEDTIPSYQDGSSAEESDYRRLSNPVEFTLRAYRELGPVFRTKIKDASWVIMAGPQANDFIWRSTDLWDFPIMFPAFGEQMGPDHLNVLEGEEHRRKRALLKPAFDHASAARYLPQINAVFHDELHAVSPDEPVDLMAFWGDTIARANTRTVIQMDVADGPLKRLVRWENQMLGGLGLADVPRMAYYGRPEYLQLKSEAMDLMGRLVDERLAHPDRYHDNYTPVLAARLQQDGLQVERQILIDDFYYIIVAGVENTARIINSTAMYCWLLPDCLKKLREEIDLWDGQDVMALSRMTYLKAMIMETHRLRPPVFFVPRHPKRDFEFEGCRIPQGTNILHANVMCHFLDEIYDEAMAFKPERFVEKGQFAPKTNGFFGGGTHLCLGRNHTLLQTPVALAQMLKHYDLAYENRDELLTTLAKVGRPYPAQLHARITPRKM